jgi:uncharacterized YigZ family protein
MSDFNIPVQESRTEIEVKKSNFIAYARHTKGLVEAKAFIHELKDKYPDARHHCYAYVAGSPNDSNLYGFSDDNEPSGTAGMPIFTHLKHSNIGEITLVVVRYFGGTKLGTGGLARAYGDAAKAVLEILPTQPYIDMTEMILTLDFALEAEIRKRISDVDGEILDVQYGEKVRIKANIPNKTKLTLPYSVSCVSASTI